MVKTQGFQCRGPRLNPWSGELDPYATTEGLREATETPRAATKTGYSQINKKNFFKMMRIGGTQHSLESVKSSQVYAAGCLIRAQNYCLGIVHCGFWLRLLDT